MRERLITGLNKSVALEIAQEISEENEALEELLSIISERKQPASAKAAWVLRTAADIDCSILKPHLSFLITELKNMPISGARRDLLKCLWNYQENKGTPEELQGDVLDLCFHRLTSPNSATAERYYAMFILGDLCKVYKELSHELVGALEMVLPHETGSFRRNAQELIVQLEAN